MILVPRYRQSGRYFLHIIIVQLSILVCCLANFPVWGGDIYFAEPEELSQQNRDVSHSLKTATENYLNRKIKVVSCKTASILGKQSDLVIAIGPQAFDEMLNLHGLSPVLAVFVSNSTFIDIQKNHPTLSNKQYSAIFSEPDPYKQVALAKLLFGVSASSVIVNSPSVESIIEDYRKAARLFGVYLDVIDSDNINSTSYFIRATKNASSLFLIKDKSLFEHVPLDKILLLSYDINRQGVIGYSSGIVNNGAIATTYSSIDNIAHAIFIQSENIKLKNSLSPPHHTNSFEVSLNKYVIRSLNLQMISELLLKEQIELLIRKGSDL